MGKLNFAFSLPDPYRVLALFFPNHCLSCGEYVREKEFVCEKCRKDLEREQRDFQLSTGGRFSVYSPCQYRDNYRYCLDRFKFEGKTGYARKFMGLAAELIPRSLFVDFNCISFVPMEKAAKRRRGYNQSQLLAKALGKLWNLPVEPMLVKTGSGPHQRSLTRAQRKENVKGLYAPIGDIGRQNIILVDDIITTGATMCQCASVLYKAGAKNIVGICAADTPSVILKTYPQHIGKEST